MEDEFLSTGDGNKFLGKVCDAIFARTGDIGIHNLGSRLTESAQSFDDNFNQEETMKQ